ncbi:MAG: hypothetical protein ABIJ14_03980 [Nanoarchaeota archaeon]|nr:hypothetical protein [Nanoarchaeota archaeon]
MKRLSEIALTGGKIIAKAVIVYGLIVAPYSISDAYAGGWRGTSRSGAQEYENKNPRKDGRFLNRLKENGVERAKKAAKKIIEFTSPERGRIINPLLDAHERGMEKGNYPGTNSGIWEQNRGRMQRD